MIVETHFGLFSKYVRLFLITDGVEVFIQDPFHIVFQSFIKLSS